MKMFIFDLDGTLIAKGGSVCLDSSYEALKLIKDHKDLIVIATGRSEYMIPESIKKLANFLISSNGQVISGNNFIDENYLTDEQVKALETIFKELNTTYNYKRHDAYHIFGDYLRAKNLELKYNAGFDKYLVEGSKKDQVYSAFLYEEDNKKVEQIRSFLAKYNLGLYKSVEYTYDIMDVNLSKATGLKNLLSHLPKVETYGFGDGENDLEFLKMVDHHFVFSDGNKNLIKQMTNIIGKSTEDSILKEVKKVYGIN